MTVDNFVSYLFLRLIKLKYLIYFKLNRNAENISRINSHVTKIKYNKFKV